MFTKKHVPLTLPTSTGMEDRAAVRIYGCGLTNAWALGSNVPPSNQDEERGGGADDVADSKGKHTPCMSRKSYLCHHLAYYDTQHTQTQMEEQAVAVVGAVDGGSSPLLPPLSQCVFPDH